jgi:hypothetical protein
MAKEVEPCVLCRNSTGQLIACIFLWPKEGNENTKKYCVTKKVITIPSFIPMQWLVMFIDELALLF